MKQAYLRMTSILILFYAASGFCANPLHEAIDRGDLATARQFIENPTYRILFFKKIIDLNEKDKNGHAPLIRAVALGYSDLVQSLVQKGADLEVTDFYGNTPLLRAVNNQNVKIVELLLRAGANLNAHDLGGRSVVQRSLDKKDKKIFEILINFTGIEYREGDNNNLLHIVAASGTAEMIAHLLSRGVDPEALNRVGRTPFMVATSNRNLEAALALYRFGISVYPRDLWKHSAGGIAYTSQFPALLEEVICEWNIGHLSESEIFFFLEYNPEPSNRGWGALKGQVLALLKRTERLDVVWRLKQVRDKLGLNPVTLQELDSRILELRRKELESFVSSRELRQSLEDDHILRMEEDGRPRTDLALELEVSGTPAFCPICLETLEDSPQRGAGPADCDCKFHLNCGFEIADNAVRNRGTEISRCVLGCGGEVTLGFLERAGLAESEILEFSKRQLALRLASCPDWKFCSTADCINGKLLLPGESNQFYCCICEKHQCLRCVENHPGECEIYKLSVQEFQVLLQAGRKVGGRFRPCYFCGVITEKNGGCNHMTCLNPACGKDWDWNTGKYAGTPTFVIERMNFTPLQEPHL